MRSNLKYSAGPGTVPQPAVARTASDRATRLRFMAASFFLSGPASRAQRQYANPPARRESHARTRATNTYWRFHRRVNGTKLVALPPRGNHATLLPAHRRARCRQQGRDAACTAAPALDPNHPHRWGGTLLRVGGASRRASAAHARGPGAARLARRRGGVAPVQGL